MARFPTREQSRAEIRWNFKLAQLKHIIGGKDDISLLTIEKYLHYENSYLDHVLVAKRIMKLTFSTIPF